MKRALVELFNKFWEKRSRDIVVGCIGRIESFDKVKMRTDVQPLLEYKASGETTATKFAVIGDVPVQFLWAGGYYIRPDYKKGDLVWVTYSTFSIEAGLSNMFDDVSTGTFSRENASVVAGVAKENWSAPDSFESAGLLVGCEGGAVIRIDGDNIIATGDKFSWGGELEVAGATESAALGDTLASILDSFCSSVSAIVAGDMAANAAALGIIKTAAATLQGQLNSIKAVKVKIE